MRVIGPGLGRTGTASLKVALERLGVGRCYHMGEVMTSPGASDLWVDAADGRPDWERIFDGYGAAADYPACAFWRELADYYPDARIVLSVRDPGDWFESTRETIFSTETSELIQSTPYKEFFEKTVWKDFGDRIHDREFMVDYFARHRSAVKDAFPEQRMLVYEVKQGWGPLCQFLELPVPDEPFPHVNSRAEFAQMLEAMRAHHAGQAPEDQIGKLAGEMFVDHKKDH